METLKYKIIKNKAQYKVYCRVLEELVGSNSRTKTVNDEIDLLSLLIEKWDGEPNTFMDMDPVSLLHSFLREHSMRAKDLVKLLNVSKGYVSDILNYKKGFSKEVIRQLAAYFKVSQEAFNRPYELTNPRPAGGRSARVRQPGRRVAA